jgi:peptide/nickel transport system ATP-binding protein
MAVVEQVSHRVAVMYLGQIVELGTRRQVFEDPRHRYTRELLSAVPVADPRRRSERRPVVAREEGESVIRGFGSEPQRLVLTDVGGGHLVAGQ